MFKWLCAWVAAATFFNAPVGAEEAPISRKHDRDLSGYVGLGDSAKYRLISANTINTKVNSELNWVSIAKYDHDNYVVANYSSLILFNRKKASVCPLQVLGDEFVSAYDSVAHTPDSNQKRIIYNPTGVFIDPQGRLYVANYKGNNILSFSLDVSRCGATFVDEFTSKQSGGPENVAVDNDKGVLVSANYDAGTVTAFSLKTKKQLWSTSIPQAHGVAISKGVVYATGLTKRKIYELDMADGTILRSAGDLGWDPRKGQFLWPTSIFDDGESGLILSDAHTGFVSKIDRQTLAASSYFGGNGPSYRYFNYPYTASVFGSEIFVLSSRRNQVIVLDKKSLAIKEGFTIKSEFWPPEEGFDYDFGRGWVGYINKSEGERINIAGREYLYGYGHLHPVLTGPVLRAPNAGTLLNPLGALYFLTGVGREWGHLYFSPSGMSLISIVRGSDRPDLVYRTEIPIDSWVVGDKIYLGNGRVLNESPIEGRARSLRKAADAIYKKRGWMSVDDYLDLMKFSGDYFDEAYLGQLTEDRDAGSAWARKKAKNLLEQVFITSSARVFFQSISDCTYKNCDANTIRSAARNYFEISGKESYVNFDEYMLVSMLSGLRPPPDKTLVARRTTRT